MKHHFVIKAKTILVYVLCFCVSVCSLGNISFFAADNNTVTVDFSHTDQNTAAALENAYDSTLFTVGENGGIADSLNFATGSYYGNYNFMLTLSKGLLDSLPKDKDNVYSPENPGYYIAYNVEGGTQLTMSSFRMGTYSEQAISAGFNLDFRFYVSADYSSWRQVIPEIITTDVNYNSIDSFNPYTKEDNYTVTIPDDARFIRICFPQTRNMSNIHWYTNGYNAYGTISTVTYTPALSPAQPLNSKTEPSRTYGKSVEFNDYKNNFSSALGEMYSYSKLSDTSSAFDINNSSAVYCDTDGNWKNLFALSKDAIVGKTDITSKYYVSYKVKPGSAFRLQSLHGEKYAVYMAENGQSYRFKFYVSANGENWRAIEPTYYSEDGPVLRRGAGWGHYSSTDTYVVDIPQTAGYIKVEFPQTKDYMGGDAPTFGPNSDDHGDWQIGTIKSVSYTEMNQDDYVYVEDIFNADQNTVASLAHTYDSTLYDIDENGHRSDILNLSTGVYYTDTDGTNKFMLTLSEGIVDSMSKLVDREYSAQNPGYYIAYNVRGGSELSLRSLRMGTFSQQAINAGMNLNFRFYISSDYENWTEVKPNITTSNVNFASSDRFNPYTKEDNYSVYIPFDANFIRICFPQTKNMVNTHWYTNGFNAYGTIASLVYVAPYEESKPLEKNICPERNYDKTFVFDDYRTKQSQIFDAMYDYSPDVFTIFNYNTCYKDSANNRRFQLAINTSAIEDKSIIDPQYYVTYKVQPGSSFKIEGMHNEKSAVIMSNAGISYRFKFYVSSDGTKWDLIEPVFYSENGPVIQRNAGWGHYSSTDTYVVDIPQTAKLITVVFPQNMDYKGNETCNFGNGDYDHGDWQIGVIKSLSYTPYSMDVTGDGEVDVRDLVRLKKMILQISQERSYDLNCDGNINSLDLGLLRKSLFDIGTDIIENWNDWNKNFDVLYPSHGDMTFTRTPTFSWEPLDGAVSYNLRIEMLENGTYVPYKNVEDILTTSYTVQDPMPYGATFRYIVEAVKSNGLLKTAANIPQNGIRFMSVVDAKNNPANINKNFGFNSNGISENVLRNYMSRMLICGVFDWHTRESGQCLSSQGNDIRMILNTGAKIVSRAYCQWTPSGAEFDYFDNMASVISQVHNIDPDIVFEACIFETSCPGMNEIPIPDWVFKAFNQPVVTRNFNYQAMNYSDGKYANKWESNVSVPDITKLETQMFIYYRAVTFIDLGFEALHFGQVDLMTENDTSHVNYTKVFNMIRDYAKTNSRRGWVLLNAHHRTGYKFADPTGKYLLEDYTGYPVRMSTSNNAVSHAPTADNPQETFINASDMYTLIGNSVSGITPSGYYTEKQLFKLELDNFGCDFNNLNKPGITGFPWGMDEISWFANQPNTYREYWLEYAYNRIHSLDSSGYFEMPGKRVAFILSKENGYDGESGYYYASDSEFFGDGFGDEITIKNIWIKNNN